MSKLLKIGIAGCGAIGSSLAKAIVSDFSRSAKLANLYDVDIKKANQLAKKFNHPELTALNLDSLIKNADLVIEATRAESAFAIAEKTLSRAKDIMIMSVGGIIRHCQKLSALAKEKNCRIYIPSGAICGIDGLKAAMCGKVNRVTLTTRKPPQAFEGLKNINKERVIFEGDAIQAIKFFPQNINVAATLSLAGIGPKDTHVRIIASPQAKRNIHEVEIESDSGKIISRTQNLVHPDNPKTSYLAVLSAVATLKQILEPIRVGT